METNKQSRSGPPNMDVTLSPKCQSKWSNEQTAFVLFFRIQFFMQVNKFVSFDAVCVVYHSLGLSQSLQMTRQVRILDWYNVQCQKKLVFFSWSQQEVRQKLCLMYTFLTWDIFCSFSTPTSTTTTTTLNRLCIVTLSFLLSVHSENSTCCTINGRRLISKETLWS